MTTEYTLYLHLAGEARSLTITGATTTDLAAQVHRHARGQLGATRVDIHLDGATLTGTIANHGAQAGTFTIEQAEIEPDNQPTETDGIRYGWTLHTLDALARSVVSNNRTWWPAGDRDDLYAAAWHGIVEHLYTATQAPRRNELMEAGRRALASDVRDNMRHHGTRRDTSNNGAKYALYWTWYGRATPSPENGIVERMALQQILPTLTDGQRRAVEALAATGDYRQAEQLLGTTNSLKSQLSGGRRRFRKLWHEGEIPSKPWGCDRRAGKTAAEITQGESALNRLRRRTRAQAA
ncbi:hypothetical protein [Streptomyces sp. NRRL B-24720]|uniref:hypothetical protein n=1 Tax=Streptomyces sp. NRRL B-24720 TaxID=1476876 RepID=UPI0004C64837|nr:hypothetical protein [Streptomyces sp. NRRL B-24720]